MKTCPDCGSRVYNLGCVNCNESAYSEEMEALNAMYGDDGDGGSGLGEHDCGEDTCVCEFPEDGA